MNERTTYSIWIACFLAGGLAGASVALLTAPQSGQETRDAMRNRLRGAADSARGLRNRVIRRSEDIRDEAARRVGAAASALAGRGVDAPAAV